MRQLTILFVCFFLHMHLNAQPIYVDISPDTVLYESYGGESYYMDMDGDGNTEIKFYQLYTGFDMLHTATRYCNGTWMGSDSNGVVVDSTGYPKQFAQGDTIGPATISWQDKGTNPTIGLIYMQMNSLTNSTLQYGTWYNMSDKFMGVRFVINGQRHYGWIRMSVDGYTALTIKDWGYNPIPDSSIVAGAGWILGIPTVETTNLATIYATNQSIFIQLNNSHKAYVAIYNSLGQKLYESSELFGESSFTMMVDKPGLYVVYVEQDDKMSVRKLIIN